MVLCGICDTWQHASCYCCLTEEDCPVLHICVLCAKVCCYKRLNFLIKKQFLLKRLN